VRRKPRLSPLPPPAELNRLLLILKHFEAERDVAVSTAVTAMASMSFGGRLPDHWATIACAAEVGLVGKAGGKLRITRLGEAFVDLNPEQNYELTEAQRLFLVERCVLNGPYSPSVREILGSFRDDTTKQSFFCDLRTAKVNSVLHQSIISFMCSHLSGPMSLAYVHACLSP
jgi:hypothetical protein